MGKQPKKKMTGKPKKKAAQLADNGKPDDPPKDPPGGGKA